MSAFGFCDCLYGWRMLMGRIMGSILRDMYTDLRIVIREPILILYLQTNGPRPTLTEQLVIVLSLYNKHKKKWSHMN